MKNKILIILYYLLFITSLLALGINTIFFIKYLCTGYFNFEYANIVSLFIGTIACNIFLCEYSMLRIKYDF